MKHTAALVFVVLLLDPTFVNVCQATAIGNKQDQMNQSTGTEWTPETLRSSIRTQIASGFDPVRFMGSMQTAPDGNIREQIRHVLHNGTSPQVAWIVRYALEHPSITNPLLQSIFPETVSPEVDGVWSLIQSMAHSHLNGETQMIVKEHSEQAPMKMNPKQSALNDILDSHFQKMRGSKNLREQAANLLDLSTRVQGAQLRFKDLGVSGSNWPEMLSKMINLPAVSREIREGSTDESSEGLISLLEVSIQGSKDKKAADSVDDVEVVAASDIEDSTSTAEATATSTTEKETDASLATSDSSTKTKSHESSRRKTSDPNASADDDEKMDFKTSFSNLMHDVVSDIKQFFQSGPEENHAPDSIPGRIKTTERPFRIPMFIAVAIVALTIGVQIARNEAVRTVGTSCSSENGPKYDWAVALCKSEWLMTSVSIVLDVTLIFSTISMIYFIHSSITIALEEQSKQISQSVSEAIHEEISPSKFVVPPPKKVARTESTRKGANALSFFNPRSSKRATDETPISLLELDDVKELDMDSLTPQQKADFKKEMIRELNTGQGFIDIRSFGKLIQKILKLDQGTTESLIRKIDNTQHTTSVGELKRESASGTISFIATISNNLLPIFVAVFTALACLGLLFLTNTSLASGIGFGLFVFAIIGLEIALKLKAKYTKSSFSEDADSMFGEMMAKKILKLMLTFVIALTFSGIYLVLSRCKTPVVMCDNNAFPICTTSGFPPRVYACNGVPDCSWNSDTTGSDMVICPSEEISGGINDHGEFTTILQQNNDAPMLVVPSRDFTIGMAYQFNLTTVSESKLLQYLGQSTTSYAYAEAGKFTVIQNLLLTLPTTILPNSDVASPITAISIAPSEGECSSSADQATILATTMAHSPDTALTSRELRNSKVLPIFTPDASTKSNFVLCYLNAGTWAAVPNAWVIIGEMGGCSDPDCSEADFSSGMSSSFFDSFYFSLITQSTIGYGDIIATSSRARLLASLQAVLMMFLDAI